MHMSTYVRAYLSDTKKQVSNFIIGLVFWVLFSGEKHSKINHFVHQMAILILFLRSCGQGNFVLNTCQAQFGDQNENANFTFEVIGLGFTSIFTAGVSVFDCLSGEGGPPP